MSNPIFTLTSTNPFGLNDVGQLARPTFVDIDGDGKLDALIGNYLGDTLFYKNTGTVNSPAFAAASTNPFGLSNVGPAARPSFVDIDDDGDLDAFVGNSLGNTQFFENTGTAIAPAFAAASTNPFGLSDVGLAATPTFGDIDGDGDLDAFIGEAYGDTFYFENTGTANAPAFAAASTNPFGLNNVGLAASTTLVDIDNDGDLDALIGKSTGDTLFFENTGTTNAPAFAAASTNPFGLSNVALAASPSFADLDGDGDLDAFVGNAYGNTLFFLNDGLVLFSTAGDDTLTGTSSLNDTASYINATSAVTVSLEVTTPQNTGHGTDTLTLIENLIGSDFNDNLKGKSGANQLEGGAGNDRLDGRGGPDVMIGGLGNDIYAVNNTGDIVTENPGEGTDKINSRVTYTLPDNVENLTLKGTAAIDGTGNDLNNKLVGNSVGNQLNGDGGNDRIDGKAGADTMTGGLGDDTYIVDNVGDIVIENASEGRDTIKSIVTYTLPNNVEKLTLTGGSPIEGTGNSANNSLIGNSANNLLSGGSGNDRLDGKGGNNVLVGGAGKDIFKLTTAGSVDNIFDFVVADDTIQLENAIFSALSSTGTLSAGMFIIGSAALDANDHIIYDDVAGELLYDADGSGVAPAIQIADITGGLAMTNADFVVI